MYIYIYMSVIAGQTAGPNRLTLKKWFDLKIGFFLQQAKIFGLM